MKNRKKILQINTYDFLMGLNENIMSGDYKCIKEALTGEYQYDERDRCRCVCSSKRCEYCIQKWLNEEENESEN